MPCCAPLCPAAATLTSPLWAFEACCAPLRPAVSRSGPDLTFVLAPPRSDPDLTFVGFSWEGADEGKMVQTFGAGRALFARFVDLQRVRLLACLLVGQPGRGGSAVPGGGAAAALLRCPALPPSAFHCRRLPGGRCEGTSLPYPTCKKQVKSHTQISSPPPPSPPPKTHRWASSWATTAWVWAPSPSRCWALSRPRTAG